MKKKSKSKLAVDILMTLTLLFLMGYQLWGETAHEWAGAFMLVLFLAHHVLNAAWHRNLFRGKYTRVRILTSAVDLVLFVVMICLMVSGITMSRYVFTFLPISGRMGTARLVHMAACYWGFVLMALHLGLHWNMMIGRFGKALGASRLSRWGTIVAKTAGAVIAVYGFFVFISRDLMTYMFLRTQFVFMDFSEPIVLFYLDYLAMMGFFIFIAHYVSKGLKKAGARRKNRRNEV